MQVIYVFDIRQWYHRETKPLGDHIWIYLPSSRCEYSRLLCDFAILPTITDWISIEGKFVNKFLFFFTFFEIVQMKEIHVPRLNTHVIYTIKCEIPVED